MEPKRVYDWRGEDGGYLIRDYGDFAYVEDWQAVSELDPGFTCHFTDREDGYIVIHRSVDVEDHPLSFYRQAIKSAGYALVNRESLLDAVISYYGGDVDRAEWQEAMA